MTQEQLKKLIELEEPKAVIKAIKDLGFTDASKHPILKEASLVAIARAENKIKVDWIYFDKTSVKASFIPYVADYPTHEFIWLQINKADKKLGFYAPHIQMIFCKEKKNA